MTEEEYLDLLRSQLAQKSSLITRLLAKIEKLERENEALRELADMYPHETVVYRG